MDKQTNISEQINRIIGDKRLSEEQLQEAESFIESFNHHDMDNYLKQQWNNAASAPSETNLSFEKITQKIGTDKNIRSIEHWLLGSAAAVIITVILFAGWLLTTTSQPAHLEYFAGNEISNQTHTSAVVLQTENDVYELTDNTIEVQNDGIAINGQENMLELHISSPTETLNEARKQSWSKLIVPRGKDFYLKLSDGTEVWINAGSTLIFPDFFEDQQRLVKLDGEAYFKVQSDVNHPFFVETPHEKVCVTGTQFNVCTYSDEPISRITLAEGKVSVSINNHEHHLMPGEQLQQIIGSGKITKAKVDVKLYTSWKDGLFEFNDMTLQEIGYRLSKWYDVEFHFDHEEIGRLRFSGMTKHEYELNYFLNIIAKTTNVKFEKNNSEIRVSEL